MTTIPEGQLDSGKDSFILKYCQRHRCPPEDFAEKVFWKCLHPLGIPLARLIWLFNADFFLSDLDLINQVKDATSSARVREIIKFFSKEPAATNFVRHRLKVRLSRSRLIKLAVAELGSNKSDADAKPPA